MVATRALLLVALAMSSVACASSGAAASRRPLPPPAGDGRAGARETRGSGPALASGAKDPAPELKPDVRRAVDAAQSLVGQRTVVLDGRDYGSGCAAVVRAAFDRAGKPLPSDARTASSLYDVARGRGALRTGIRCAPGDVVFLADKPGGAANHVGLVTRVDPDGTAVVVHRLARGVGKMRVNLGYPARVADPATGKRLNDTLQVGKGTAPAGSLVVGVAALL
ncbi:MAG TPA: CHAP domain-containing protein [Anaeromyxobacteraceae bacterium]|nr:CHAP domain-containing protein [Anaeromyxobacteraceae bacterium]